MEVIEKLIGSKIQSASKPEQKKKVSKKEMVMIGEEPKGKTKYDGISKDEVISLIKDFIRHKEEDDSD